MGSPVEGSLEEETVSMAWPAMPCSRAEQRDQLDSGGLCEDFHGGAPLKIHAGVIGDQADVFAA